MARRTWDRHCGLSLAKIGTGIGAIAAIRAKIASGKNSSKEYNSLMEWLVEYTDEFGCWWDTMALSDQICIGAHVRKLEQRGPQLPFPYSSGIKGSRHTHMRELRVQSGGKPLADIPRL